MRRIFALFLVHANMLVMAALSGGTGAAAADASSTGSRVPLTPKYRACDFTWATNVPTNGTGTGSTVISKAEPNKVTAQVQVLAAEPRTHYDVRLIQSPRPSVGCAAGDAGVTAAGIDTDGSGAGSVTLEGTISANTTGVWVFVDRPSPHSQRPIDFYTSEIIAPI
ncbi:hypothetical protein [Mycobacterium shigaense]|uniref:Uncharacterized protein n=1 Tax=Mycobacterium shigaense TaxID=722731 RepID=A0A1Z4ENL2_9MYCO|nr:hypothetical protein [Mycobacterium shigaense]MEA1120467.1 hypothetical protein [Mycobacterium shigaense]PRI14296.1 hypothetical protein B2J96_16460 [Mycobacterium shigaense]BAX94466.1 hypothetical protein MSG_04345 [Mycobacterium shigaense]